MNDSVDNKLCTVLVVDDEATTADLVADVLIDAGFNTERAYCGQDALECFSAQVIDVVITDIRMDDISGFEVMRRVHAIDSATKVIVMTAYDSYDMVLRALQAGAYDYLNKPLDDHSRIVQATQRAGEYSKLVRENQSLLVDLQHSHSKLSAANRRLVDLNKSLKILANTDSLTKLYNRRYCESVLDKESRRHNRYDTNLSVVIFDVDYFKKFNDEHGHDTGDEVLKHVANLLLDCARSTDIVARYGGEEFLVVLPETDASNALIFADRARIAINKYPIKIDGHVHNISVSAGLVGAVSGDRNVSTRQLINQADSALYEAKNSGRNSCVVYSADDAESSVAQDISSPKKIDQEKLMRDQAEKGSDGPEDSPQDSEAA